MIDNKKISYFDYLKSGQNADCTNALKSIAQRIDLSKINDIIDNSPLIHDQAKAFYKFMLKERKSKILDKAIEMLSEMEKPSLKAKLESAKKEASLSAPKASEKKSNNVQLSTEKPFK